MNGGTIVARLPPQLTQAPWLTEHRRRAARHGLIVAGIAVAIAAAWISYFVDALDAHAYWAARAPGLYDLMPGEKLAYLYSPAFAQMIAPLQGLPEQVFVVVWLAAIVTLIAWLVGPRLLPFAIVLAWSDIQSANLHTFLAVAIVFGFRTPVTWAFVLLTKVTPGIGLLWFARRRAWRALAGAAAATAGIALLSFVADPQSWLSWFDLLARSAGGPSLSLSGLTPLWIRLPISAALIWWGASRDAKWTVPVAAILALPIIWPASLAMLLAIPRLLDRADARLGWRSAFS